MTDTELDALLERTAQTPSGCIALTQIGSDLAKIAPALGDADHAPAAFAVLERWAADTANPLRKALSEALMMRARSVLAPAVERLGATVDRWGAFRQKIIQRGGDIGESVGRNLGAKTPEMQARVQMGIKDPAVERVAQAGRSIGTGIVSSVSSPYALRHAAEGAVAGYALSRALRSKNQQPKAPAA